MNKTPDAVQKDKIPVSMYVAQCFAQSWNGYSESYKQCVDYLPTQWSTILKNNIPKIEACQENEKHLNKISEQLKLKLEQENRKSWSSSKYVRICNLAANMSFEEAIPAAQKLNQPNLRVLVHSHWELQMLKWIINIRDNSSKIKENKRFAKLSSEGTQIKDYIKGVNKTKEQIEKQWCAAFQSIFNKDSKQTRDSFFLPTQIKVYMNSMAEMKKILSEKDKKSFQVQIRKIYHNICSVENKDQQETSQEMLRQIQRRADQILNELTDLDRLKVQNKKLEKKIGQIYDHSSALTMQHNGINVIAERSLTQKIEQIKDNMSTLSNTIYFISNERQHNEENYEHKSWQLDIKSNSIDPFSAQKQRDYGKLKQEKSQRITIEGNIEILRLEEEVAQLKNSLEEMKISRDTYRDSFNNSDQECKGLNNLIALAKAENAEIMAKLDLDLAMENKRITILENEKTKQPQRVDASLQVDIPLTNYSQSSESQTEKSQELAMSIESKLMFELIHSSTQTELELRSLLTQAQHLQQNKQAVLRQELNWSVRENSSLKQEIRQLKLQQSPSIQHLFTAGGIIDIKDTEIISFLAAQIQRLTRKSVLKSKLLVRSDPLNKINMHQYIDCKESLLVLVKTAKGQLVACYSQSPCQPNKHAILPSLLLSLTNKRSFRLIEGKKAIVYDPYTFIFGNHELRFSTDAKVLYSNFAIVNCSFNPEGQKVDCILGESNLKEVPMAAYEFYQVEFNGQN